MTVIRRALCASDERYEPSELLTIAFEMGSSFYMVRKSRKKTAKTNFKRKAGPLSNKRGRAMENELVYYKLLEVLRER